jgi:tRNA 2-thiocytidine biosynthesis protein TtcA
VCGDLGLQRQRMKRLLMDLEREHPDVKQSMLKALGNVHPRHLLDVRQHFHDTSHETAPSRVHTLSPT